MTEPTTATTGLAAPRARGRYLLSGAVGLTHVIAALILVIAAATTAAASESTPAGVVESALTRVIAIAELAPESGVSKVSALAARRVRIGQVLSEVVDFEEMSRRVLGPHWSALSPTEQREFAVLFARLLTQSYLGRADSFAGHRMQFISETVTGDTAVVMWAIGGTPRNEVTAEYGRARSANELKCSLLRSDGQWRIYDVGVDGFSLVGLYRSQFARILQSESYAGLVIRLRQKVGTAAASIAPIP